MIISAQIISATGGWYTTRPCAQIASTLSQSTTLSYYPACSAFFSGANPSKRVIVTADFASGNPIELSAALAMPFGSAGWIALLLHTVAVEVYVSHGFSKAPMWRWRMN